jgi:hypothetical protein
VSFALYIINKNAMKPIFSEQTINTPYINFDPQSGSLEISGRSIPEDSVKFYKPLIQWIDEYKKSPQDLIIISIRLEYFNSGTAKSLYRMLKKITTMPDAINKVKIQWYYEHDDEEMMNSAKDYEILLNFPIQAIHTH